MLADENHLGIRTGEPKQFFVGEEVVNNTVGALENGFALERQKAGIARPRTDEIDFAPHKKLFGVRKQVPLSFRAQRGISP
jgi:hypothetical protein